MVLIRLIVKKVRSAAKKMVTLTVRVDDPKVSIKCAMHINLALNIAPAVSLINK